MVKLVQVYVATFWQPHSYAKMRLMQSVHRCFRSAATRAILHSMAPLLRLQPQLLLQTLIFLIQRQCLTICHKLQHKLTGHCRLQMRLAFMTNVTSSSSSRRQTHSARNDLEAQRVDSMNSSRSDLKRSTFYLQVQETLRLTATNSHQLPPLSQKFNQGRTVKWRNPLMNSQPSQLCIKIQQRNPLIYL